MSKFRIGDRVLIVKSYFKEDPSRMAGGTGTVVKTYDNDYGVDLRVDNDPGDYGEDMRWTFPVDYLEKIEEQARPFQVGDLVTVGRDTTWHGFEPGTVARVLEVCSTSDPEDKSLYVTTLPEGEAKDLAWTSGQTAYVNYSDDDSDSDHVGLFAPVGSEAAVSFKGKPKAVTYDEFRNVILNEGVVAAFDRFDIRHK